MPHNPLRLLISAYALAALVAGGVAGLGAGLWTALLMAWLAAPVFAVALATLPGLRNLTVAPPQPEAETLDDWRAKERELAAWDRDLAAESVAPEANTGAARRA